jgi:hypothetical protein
MQTMLGIELRNGFRFSVEHDVKTVADVQRLLQKGQARLAAVKKAIPEIATEPVAKVRMGAVHERPAASGPETKG